MRLSSQTLGQIVAEGNRYKVHRTPAGAFRVALRANPEIGAVFYWKSNFRWAVGEPKSPEEVDSQCVRLIGKTPASVQAALIGS